MTGPTSAAFTDQNRPADPHRGRGFEHFRAAYIKKVRPEGLLDRLRRAFDIGAELDTGFRGLRPVLREAQKEWPEAIVSALLKADAIRADFSSAEMDTLRERYQRHAKLFAAGRFDEAYLDSLEEVALMFLYAEVRSVWLAGVYGQLEEDVVDRTFELAALPGAPRVRPMMRAFSKAMTIELSQIQRVFICYERAVAAEAAT